MDLFMHLVNMACFSKYDTLYKHFVKITSQQFKTSHG